MAIQPMFVAAVMDRTVPDTFAFREMDAAPGALDHSLRPAFGGSTPGPESAPVQVAEEPENDQDQPDQEQVFHHGSSGVRESAQA
jgi:hypothetical protein